MIQFTQCISSNSNSQLDTKQSKSELTLCLTMDERTKSRLKVTLSNGQVAGLFLPRGTVLKEGDLLKADTGEFARVEAAEEMVSTVFSEDHLLLAKACYHLGNRHVPLQVEQGWCRYLHDHVLDDMVKGLGLGVRVERAKYQPEPGAYGGSTAGSSHGHHH
ncbi:urease accessory protein UreE [Vibrio alfacsensis]|uniref:urease accessory protein UreE n=1 Tax=Vibrio alfacsensis TaxID=1074311 RepID=UPI002ADD4A9C|nr:urease accessory protein UreE [Vibrio alfacsensis]WQE78432.1 urease accessory protein UreE [Vibrio alfacsensis]